MNKCYFYKQLQMAENSLTESRNIEGRRRRMIPENEELIKILSLKNSNYKHSSIHPSICRQREQIHFENE